MSKWDVILSTTEPYNYVGIIKVRQSNVNSEILKATIVVNGKPYDLSNVRVLFCTHFDPYVTVEKEAQIVDKKNGIVQFTLDADCMQQTGEREAYFEIYKEDVLMDTTQNFSYFVQTSIEKMLMDGESYIQRLEDLLKKLKDQMEQSQAEVDKWLSDNRAEIDRLMNDITQFFIDQKIEFSEWFESVRSILESVDPGGILLNEIINARKSVIHGNFPNLSERLNAGEKTLQTVIPNGEAITIQHNLNQYPLVLVTSWINGLGTTGIGSKTAFGSDPETITSKVLYPDKQTILVKVPNDYSLTEPTITETKPNSYLLVDGLRSLRITIIKGDLQWN